MQMMQMVHMPKMVARSEEELFPRVIWCKQMEGLKQMELEQSPHYPPFSSGSSSRDREILTLDGPESITSSFDLCFHFPAIGLFGSSCGKAEVGSRNEPRREEDNEKVN